VSNCFRGPNQGNARAKLRQACWLWRQWKSRCFPSPALDLFQPSNLQSNFELDTIPGLMGQLIHVPQPRSRNSQAGYRWLYERTPRWVGPVSLLLQKKYSSFSTGESVAGPIKYHPLLSLGLKSCTEDALEDAGGAFSAPF
jgi:hypothetical protein